MARWFRVAKSLAVRPFLPVKRAHSQGFIEPSGAVNGRTKEFVRTEKGQRYLRAVAGLRRALADLPRSRP